MNCMIALLQQQVREFMQLFFFFLLLLMIHYFLAVGVTDMEARVACVARIISYLPPGNRATLKRLCQFLR